MTTYLTANTGFASPIQSTLDRPLDLNEHLITHPNATFFVRAKGNQMQSEGIADQDLLVVDRSISPQDNHLVLIYNDATWQIKRLKEARAIASDSDDMVTWGVVTYVIHHCLH